MLGKEIIMRDLTVLDLEAKSWQDVLISMNERLCEQGYVNNTYLETILKREAEYPTALPVEPYPIAIPHTETGAIERPFIAPIRLRTPVAWGDMSDPEHTFDVRLVFCLGFRDAGAHIELLQILVHNFQRPDWVEALFSAQSEDEFYDVVAGMEWTAE